MLILAAAVLSAPACQKELDGGRPEVQPVTVPTGFMWLNTQDVTLSVGMPATVEGTPAYAVIRVYSSAVLSEDNLVGMGVVKPSSPTFRTAFTIPAAAENIYVQTTLPDGTIAVRAVSTASKRIDLPGAVMKSADPAVSESRSVAPTSESSMPSFPTLAEKGAGDFPTDAVIGKTPSKAFKPVADAYIPAGAVIEGNIDLSGAANTPVLYVAGELKMTDLTIGNATLAVLRGGKVTIAKELKAENVGAKEQPAIYVFEGGQLTVKDDAKLSCKSVVNCGTIEVADDLELYEQLVFYNAAGANLKLTGKESEIETKGSTQIFNDGTIVTAEVDLGDDGGSSTLTNCENGELTIGKLDIDDGNKLVQKGLATITYADCDGEMYINCYTKITEKLKSEDGKIYLAAAVGLDCEEVEFEEARVYLASGSIFTMVKYGCGDDDDVNVFESKLNDDADVHPVVCIKNMLDKKATIFKGPMEIVYNGAIPHSDRYLKDGAVVRDKQTVVIPESVCNGGKTPVTPEPEPEPEYIEVGGKPFTCCFEDNWPYLGDYDMNDAVVLTKIDRRMSNDGSKVEFIRINWELKAAGAVSKISYAVQLDNVAPGQIASIATTNTSFGDGPFASATQPETGNDAAVIPLFNSVPEVLSSANTWPKLPAAATTKHTTTITFAQPVDAEAVIDSKFNFFIVVNRDGKSNERDIEVHMPGYNPTSYARITGWNTVRAEDPYKFFTMRGDDRAYNGMMWGLTIPGDFRYPSEQSDIRGTYTYFNAWVASGGTQHKEWYAEEFNEQSIY